AARMTWYLGAHHVASPRELDLFVGHLSYAMQRVGLAYVMYLALEPYARRLWPNILTSWVRVLDGRFRDSLVGRDLLVGCAAGARGVFLARLATAATVALRGSSGLPQVSPWTLEALRGPTPGIVAIVGIHTQELLSILLPITLLVILRLLLRRTDLAVIAVSVIAILIFYPESGNTPGYLLGFSLTVVIAWLCLFRFGLLALATAMNIAALVAQMPLTWHREGWSLGVTLLALAAVTAPALWGFWTSQAGRPLFRDTILEPAANR